jgi:o-succinylbenzoate synthase
MNWSLRSFSLALDSPLETAGGPIEERSGWLVSVRTAEERGVGEATPLAGWTESHEECERALAGAVEALNRLDEAESIRERLDGIDSPAARHGCHLALADLRARQAGEPLYRWLGASQSVDTIPVNATVGDCPPAETVSRTRAAVEAGYDCVKLKLGVRAPAADAARLRAVREQVSESVSLRVDVNGAWDRQTARAALAWLDEADVAVLEQPLDPTDLDGHAMLRGSGVDVAVDETLATVTVEGVLDAAAADILVCKPMVLGGIDRALDVASVARERGLTPVVTTTIDAAIARAGTRHLAAVLQPSVPFGLATGDLLTADLVSPEPVCEGSVSVSQTPGHGIQPATFFN